MKLLPTRFLEEEDNINSAMYNCQSNGVHCRLFAISKGDYITQYTFVSPFSQTFYWVEVPFKLVIQPKGPWGHLGVLTLALILQF